jgi:hypothetical protein
MNSGYWNWNIFFPSQVVGNNPDMGQDGHKSLTKVEWNEVRAQCA